LLLIRILSGECLLTKAHQGSAEGKNAAMLVECDCNDDGDRLDRGAVPFHTILTCPAHEVRGFQRRIAALGAEVVRLDPNPSPY